jgi:multimeric flavodoxin WrbA
MTDVRKGQPPSKLDRAEFGRRFRERFSDPAFESEKDAVARLESIAWDAYEEGRKAPRTRPAGPGYADPTYELSIEWLEAKARIDAAMAAQKSSGTPTRLLIVGGGARNEGTCPGEMSKTWRLLEVIRAKLANEPSLELDVLDLSVLTAEYGRTIHPCKACVSTAMPLCHWPCSCYPNHSLGQAPDWMNDIYERWARAHGVIIVTPVYWYQAPSTLKLMIERLVCADGGNADPTSTSGKKPEKAKALELAGWDYPQHLAGRVFGLIVHGDAAGVESLRRSLADWLEDIGMIPAGPYAILDRHIGYYEPYATSHEALDRDKALIKETENVALSVAEALRMLRAGELVQPGANLPRPRPK